MIDTAPASTVPHAKRLSLNSADYFELSHNNIVTSRLDLGAKTRPNRHHQAALIFFELGKTRVNTTRILLAAKRGAMGHEFCGPS